MAQTTAHANAYARPAHLDLDRNALFVTRLMGQRGQSFQWLSHWVPHVF